MNITPEARQLVTSTLEKFLVSLNSPQCFESAVCNRTYFAMSEQSEGFTFHCTLRQSLENPSVLHFNAYWEVTSTGKP